MDGFETLCPACQASLPPLDDSADTLACPSCGKILTAYEVGMAEVRACIRKSALVNGIARYRKLTGVDLQTAKDVVSEMWHNGDW